MVFPIYKISSSVRGVWFTKNWKSPFWKVRTYLFCWWRDFNAKIAESFQSHIFLCVVVHQKAEIPFLKITYFCLLALLLGCCINSCDFFERIFFFQCISFYIFLKKKLSFEKENIFSNYKLSSWNRNILKKDIISKKICSKEILFFQK